MVDATQSISQQAVPQEEALPRESLQNRYDVTLALVAIALVALGLVMVASASVSTAERRLGDPLFYFWRQTAFVVLGLAVGWVATRVSLERWRQASSVLLVLGAVLLVAVLVPGIGKEVKGSMRWIRLGPFGLQPSELMKLFVALYLAGYLVRRSEEVRSVFGGFLKPIAVLVLLAVLLLMEPDYGATLVIFAVALGMLFLGGVPLLSFVGWGAAVAACLAAVIVAAPYRLARLTTFMDPWSDPFGSGFQLTQALIAVGRGEWFGVGLGNSIQKLFYLPEAHTDFVFAVLAEELGLIGMAVVIGLYAFIVWRAFSIARRAEAAGESYGAYLAQGLGLLMFTQASINIGVNLGMLPTKGLALPLMSYGGSSLLVNCAIVGLLVRVDHELRKPPA